MYGVICWTNKLLFLVVITRIEWDVLTEKGNLVRYARITVTRESCAQIAVLQLIYGLTAKKYTECGLAGCVMCILQTDS